MTVRDSRAHPSRASHHNLFRRGRCNFLVRPDHYGDMHCMGVASMTDNIRSDCCDLCKLVDATKSIAPAR